jgi:ABC-type phosphate transport system ATPase subunit
MNLGITNRVAEDVSRLVNEDYINITIEPYLGGKLAIYGFLKDGTRIRLGDMGAGTQIYIIARMLYELKKPKILLWDDVESHLNPRMLLSIAEWFSELIEEGNQVVLTTHSLEAARMIAGLNEENTLIYLTSLEDGVLRTQSMSLRDVEDLLEAGVDIRLAERVLL